ncbi:acetylcholinesterase-like [Rhipicephalus microplus]|uniref:acetylcholinesterase-like n=1 Tax=Rhipicephalus microplus TaxID=6941 RepID=UPI003F6AE025
MAGMPHFTWYMQKGMVGGTLDSLEKRPPCPQQDFFLGQQLVNTANGSEDCLHVNIWAPTRNCSSDAEHGSCQGKTVLFFLYGASFQNGGNSFELYDGRYLSALGDIVVVVPNYRVGAMGFLSGPSPNTLPGNVGLHDQRLALSWTLANIELFGGNASRLVLAGHDAGATSLGYHLFGGDSGFWTRSAARFILQSGGPFHRYLQLWMVGCGGKMSASLVQWLRCSAADPYGGRVFEPNRRLHFDGGEYWRYEGDGVEGTIRLATSLQCPADLVTEASLRCLQNASANATSGPQAKQFLLGRVQNEGAYPWFVEQQRTGSSDPQQLATRLIGYDNLDRWQNATGAVLDPTADEDSYQEAVGDVLEACPMSRLAEQLHASKNRVYAYVLGYRPMYSSWTDETEAVHFDDMELVFGVPLRPGSPSSQMDKQWSRTMIHVWSTFARTGKPPTVKTSKWPAYDSHRLTTMKLGPRGVTAQRDPKWQRCRALRDSGGAAVSTSPLRATQHGHYAPSRRP